MDRGGKELQHDGQIMESRYSTMDRGGKVLQGKELQHNGQIMERSYSTMDRSWKAVTARWTDHGKKLQHDGQMWKGQQELCHRHKYK